MWTTIILVLLLGTLIALLLVVLNSFTKKVTDLERQRAEIEVEEDRVFDFLHGLGEAFSEGVVISELHRLIVESAVRILDAHGGSLYLEAKGDEKLTPAFVSKGCPPLVPLPPHLKEGEPASPAALDSFLRLHPVRRGEGLIGHCWASGQPGVYKGSENGIPLGGSALIGPLVYRRKILGILAVASGPASTPFGPADLKVFKAICEQCAFALYSEVVYSEASEKKRLDHDLEIAREIQGILLPSSAPAVSGYDICGTNIPAKQVSGDYYDYIQIDPSLLGVAIADVSGKGIPASLIMAMCRSVIRIEAMSATSSSEVLRRVNRQLYPDIKEDMFISMAYLVLDAASNQATLARAGHDAPLLYRASTKEVEKLSPKGMALGIDSGEVFNRVCADLTVQLEKGDCILLYTDGATEALDHEGAEYGLPRLVQGLQASAPHGAESIVRFVAEDVKNFVGTQPQHDDITLIAIAKT